MARLQPLNPGAATQAAAQAMERARAAFGLVPNLMRTFANSPAVLNAFLDFHQALGTGNLTPQVREQIALVVSETNECEYCLSAHTAIGKLYGINERDLKASRTATTVDARTNAALSFAREVVVRRGRISDMDFDRVRQAGFSDGEIAEIIANVALTIFTNYFNHISQTDVDFPRITPLAAPSAA